MTSIPDISKYLKKKKVDIHWTPNDNRWEKKFLGDISNFNDDFRKKLDMQFQQHVKTKKTPKRTPKNKVLSVENSGEKIENPGSRAASMYDVVKSKSQVTKLKNQDQKKNNDSDLENQDPRTTERAFESPTMYDLVKTKSNQKSDNSHFLNQNQSSSIKQKHRSSSGSKQKQNPRSSVKRSSSNSGIKKVSGTSGPETKFVKNLTSDFKMQITNVGPSPFKLQPKRSENSDICTQLFSNNNIQTPSTKGKASTAKQRSRRQSLSVATPRISQNYQDDEIQITHYNNHVLFNMQDTLRILNLSSQKKEIKNFDQSKKIKIKSVNKIGRSQEILFLTQTGIKECIQISNYQNKNKFNNWIQQMSEQT